MTCKQTKMKAFKKKTLLRMNAWDIRYTRLCGWVRKQEKPEGPGAPLYYVWTAAARTKDVNKSWESEKIKIRARRSANYDGWFSDIYVRMCVCIFLYKMLQSRIESNRETKNTKGNELIIEKTREFNDRVITYNR